MGTLLWRLISGLFEKPMIVIFKFLTGYLDGLAQNFFYAETVLENHIGGFDFGTFFSNMRLVTLGLLVVLFLKKGFEVYVLWTDGDSGNSPVTTLWRFIQAVALMFLFPTAYDFGVEMIGEFQELITFPFTSPEKIGLRMPGIFELILYLVIIVMSLLLFFQFIKKSIEVLILRLIFPFAVLGLIQDDKGSFPAYMKTLIQSMFTVVLQITLFKVALHLCMFVPHGKEKSIFETGGFGNIDVMFYGIAILMLALSVPQLLNQFMIPQQGGGISSIYHGGRMAGSAGRGISRGLRALRGR